MIIRVIEKEKWTNKKRPCQKKYGRYTSWMDKIELFCPFLQEFRYLNQ